MMGAVLFFLVLQFHFGVTIVGQYGSAQECDYFGKEYRAMLMATRVDEKRPFKLHCVAYRVPAPEPRERLDSVAGAAYNFAVTANGESVMTTFNSSDPAIRIAPIANTQQEDRQSRLVHQGGEAPSFGPVRQPR